MSKSMALPLRRVCQSLARESFRSLSDRELLEQFAAGNQAAFAAIVERHGPVVCAVCLRALCDSGLADDAFQAVFVVLARKSRSLRRPDALAGWLFGVACRIAGQMRQAQIRLRRREQLAALLRPEADEPKPWDDLLQVLDEELNHLPERLRAPLVACYLQGRTQDEAARELDWPLITLRRRLAAGRERLRLRMARRGATLSAGLLAAALTPSAADATVPIALAEITVTHALAVLHGQAIPTAIAELAREQTAGSIGAAKLWLVPMIAACALVGVGTFKPWTEKPLKAMPADKPAEKPKEVRRDRFNDPLPEGAIARLGTIALKHGGKIDELRFAPDNKSFYSTGGGILRGWQVDTGNEIKTIDMRSIPKEVRAQSISSDGKTVFAVIGDEHAWPPVLTRLEEWDVTSMKKRREFTINQKDGRIFVAEQVSLSPNVQFVAVKWSSAMVLVWDCSQAKLIFTIPGWNQILTFSSDDRRLITCDSKFKITVRECATGRVIKELGSNENQPCDAVISPDGKWLATSGQAHGESKLIGNGLGRTDVISDPFIRLWDLERGNFVEKIEAIAISHRPMAFAGDSKSIFVMSRDERRDDYSIRRIAIPGGETISTFPEHLPSIEVLTVSPNGRMLAPG